LESIVSAVRQALEQTPPDLGSDVAESGVMLTGDGALPTQNMDKLMTTQIGLPVLIANDPMTCVARAGAAADESRRRLNDVSDASGHPGLVLSQRRRCASNSRAGK